MKGISRQRDGNGRYNKQATRRGDQKKGWVAQSSRRVKDKRLRRACGILDPSRCQCYKAIKGLLPTPVKQG